MSRRRQTKDTLTPLDEDISTEKTVSRRSKRNMKTKNKPKALSSLQVDANDPLLLVGGTKTPSKQKHGPKKERISRSISPLLPEIPVIVNKDGSFKIEREHVSQSVSCTQTEPLKVDDMGTQTCNEESIDYQMVCNEVPPPQYWEMLAEQRRIALVETVNENEMLYREIEHLRETIKDCESHKNSALYFQFMYRIAHEESAVS